MVLTIKTLDNCIHWNMNDCSELQPNNNHEKCEYSERIWKCTLWMVNIESKEDGVGNSRRKKHKHSTIHRQWKCTETHYFRNSRPLEKWKHFTIICVAIQLLKIFKFCKLNFCASCILVDLSGVVILFGFDGVTSS